jgi:SAM-dependent methyltransferase
VLFLSVVLFFTELYKDTTDLCIETLESLGGSKNCTFIEVGCGTGETIYSVMDASKYCIGVDINPKFIDWCCSHCPKEYFSKTEFICGDATDLFNLLKEKVKFEIWNGPRVVACVGNTFGIMPNQIKEKIIDQMAEVAGSDGKVIFVYWNADYFADAIKNFYGKNPQLCGIFTEKDVDYKNFILNTPSGYYSHWTSVSEAKQVLKSHNLIEIKVEGKGKGVLVVTKKP